VPIRYVLVRDVAGEFKPQAFLCTNLGADPLDILRWFVPRWSVEVPFAEVRRHLGAETSGNGPTLPSRLPRPHELLQQNGVCGCRRRWRIWRRIREQRTAQRQLSGAMAVRQEADMADAVEPDRQACKQEPPNELVASVVTLVLL
jgi:hypothetical protein